MKKIVYLFKKYWKFDLGIHTHNNLNLALKNSIQAGKLGVVWIDSTITGMGRGPGNTTTERLLKKNLVLINLKNLSQTQLLNFL